MADSHSASQADEQRDRTEPDAPPALRGEARAFEELSLLELLSRFVAAPRVAWRELRQASRGQRPQAEIIPATVKADDANPASAAPTASGHIAWRLPAAPLLSRERAQFALYAVALLFALAGTGILLARSAENRIAEDALSNGAPFLWLAFLLWLFAELFGNWPQLEAWWRGLDRLRRWIWIARAFPALVALSGLHTLARAMGEEPTPTFDLIQAAAWQLLAGVLALFIVESFAWRARAPATEGRAAAKRGSDASPNERIARRQHINRPLSHLKWRAAHIAIAVICSLAVWLGTSGNQFPPSIILLWLVSAALWALVFAPAGWSVFDWLSHCVEGFRRRNWSRRRWALLGFLLIMILGASFRLHRLDEIPGEMTSDHVEIILDAQRLRQGNQMLFFPNLGGREPIHYYAIALLASLPGFEVDFLTIKTVSVLESLLVLPAMLLLGKTFFGGRSRQFGLMLGMIAAALVAVSYWQSSIARLGMRVPLTALFTTLLLIFLARAMRHNRRSDFVVAGLLLGFSLYSYQASRMLPVVVLAGMLLALALGSGAWKQRRAMLANLAILVFMSGIVFLPLLRYWQEYPDRFWMRASTRILGDQHSEATFDQAISPLLSSLPQLLTNTRRALLVYNWEGDIAWFHGRPHQPALDMYSGAFLILGLAAWLAAALRTRDPVIWFMPVAAFIMLLPTILSVAHPGANPSFTRSNGSLPMIYLIAALPIAVIASRLMKLLPRRPGRFAALIFCATVILLANHQNAITYFDEFPKHYDRATYGHSAAGRILRGFAESDGAYGNAFVLSLAHWWDHRAVGLEAGQFDWDGNPALSRVPEYMRRAYYDSGEYRLHPDRDLLFFYPGRSDEIRDQLGRWFPNGRESLVSTGVSSDSFYIYRVPALGEAGISRFLNENV